MDFAAWGHPASEFPAGQDSLKDIAGAFGRLKDCGLDVYHAFVMSGGKHYFESQTLGAPERDLLGPCVEAGAQVGLEVHPIIGLGAVSASTGEGLYDPGPSDEPLPSWALNWPCAAWSENRSRTCTVAREMMEIYRPDGLHMDYLRYPNSMVLNTHPCRCERCQAEREQWLGKPLLDADDLQNPGMVYQEIKMRGRFVKSVVHGLREVADDAGAPLSLAARARYLKDAVPEGQDWVEWCAEGLLDFVCPMSYNPCHDRFQRFVAEHTGLLTGVGTPLYCGIGRSSSLGKIDAQEMSAQTRHAAAQGAEGICLFHVRALEEEDLAVLKELAEELK
ncbi:hypothetical protein LLH23_13730 [bacterium]|nr:hypothetical protein [bacterium]